VKKVTLLFFVVFLIALASCGNHKGYIIVQKSRDLSFGSLDNTRFQISPAKVQISKLKVGQTIRIPVKILNKGDRMLFQVSEEQPPVLDNGYLDAGGDYSYEFSDSLITVDRLYAKTVTFSIKRVTKGVIAEQEKGFRIAQIPDSSQSVAVARAYIFEVLLPESKK
jgi:hypothetical protein